METKIGFTHTDQGLRQYQEDRYFNDVSVIGSKMLLYGIFDGHGKLGGYVAEECVTAFPHYMRAHYAHGDVVETFFKTFQSVDDRVGQIRDADLAVTGSTAILTFLSPTGIWIANAGDSLAVIVLDNGECRMITKEHKVSAPEEMARIRSSGGVITYDDLNNPNTARINNGLNVARGIGDFSMKRYFICRPDIRNISTSLQSHVRYIIMASDGLWDVMREGEVQATIHGLSDPDKIARGLVDTAKRMGSTDNITVTVIDVESYQRKANVRNMTL